MAKAPQSFDFYVNDFLAGTQHMTPAEVGAYLRILCYQWSNGSAPRDPSRLSRICVCSLEEMQRIWPGIEDKFVSADAKGDQMVNPRMEADRESSVEAWMKNVAKKNKKDQTREHRKAAGRKGGLKSQEVQRKQNRSKKVDFPEGFEANAKQNEANENFASNLLPQNSKQTAKQTGSKKVDFPEGFEANAKQTSSKTSKPEGGRWKEEGGILNLSGDVTRKPTHTQNAHASDRDDRDLQKEPDRQTTKPPAEPERGEFVWRSTVNGRVSKFRIDEAHDTPKFRESLGLWLESIEIDTGAAVNAIRIQVQLSNLSTQCPDAKSASEALIRSMTQAAKPGQVYYHPLPERAPGAKFGAQDRSEERRLPTPSELRAAGVI